MKWILIIGLVVYWSQYKKKEKLDISFQQILKKVITVIVILTVISMLPIISSIGSIALVFAWPFLILWLLKRVNKVERKKEETVEQYVTRQPRGLDKSSKVRHKIVSRFNKMYELRLTDDQMDCIVDASYASLPWENEIAYMQQQYNSVAEWYSAPTGWLRAYLRVFYVQEVNCDFAFQRQICVDAYKQIFDETKFNSFYSLNEAIEFINNKYMVNFDTMSFMIAYRFLEANGFRYQLPGTKIVRNEDDVDRLAKKYDAQDNTETKSDADRKKTADSKFDADTAETMQVGD